MACMHVTDSTKHLYTYIYACMAIRAYSWQQSDGANVSVCAHAVGISVFLWDS